LERISAIILGVPRVGEDLIEELHSRQEPRLLRALETVAPGTALREGIDNCVLARTGALIVIGDEDGLAPLLSGGIKLDIEYSPAILYQLAKMDGAIALSQNATKIMWANVQLTPDPTILSRETGTRHRTAERVSKQTDGLVISISERREVVSLFAGGAKYVLQEIPAVLARANQALATLDKYRARFDQVSMRLTALEFEGGVTLHDALTVLQRSEMVTRMAVEIERYIVELGAEGRLIEMQLEEMLTGVAADRSALVRDYIVDYDEESFTAVMETLPRLPNQDLLDFGRLGELLGYDRKLNTLDFPVTPRGYRILGRIPRLPEAIVQNVVYEFGTFDVMLAATSGELEGVEGVGEVRAKEIREGLRRLQEINLVDRYLQT
jgi:diadenylate cyclase